MSATAFLFQAIVLASFLGAQKETVTKNGQELDKRKNV